MNCPHCKQPIAEPVVFTLEGYEVTKPVKAETYEEAKRLCPEGFRLPFLWEQFKILQPRNNRKLLYDGDYNFFWSATIDENRVRGLYLNWGLDLYEDWNQLAIASSYGRVFFVRELKENK